MSFVGVGVLGILPLDAPASEANCVAVLGNMLVLSTLVGVLKCGEVNMSEKDLEE